MTAFTVEQFWASAYGAPGSFDGLLAARLVERMAVTACWGCSAPI